MKENESFIEDIKVDELEASYAQKILVYIIDFAIEIIVFVIFYFLLLRNFTSQLFEIPTYMTWVIAFVIISWYRIISILVFGRTIGMRIIRVKYLNNKLLQLTLKEKLIAVLRTTTQSIKYYKL